MQYQKGNTFTPDFMKIPRVHSYCKFILHQNNIEIYQGDKRILSPDTNIYANILSGEREPLKQWRVNKVEPYIETFNFKDRVIGEYTRRITVDELAQLGVGLYSKALNLRKGRAYRQYKEYYLANLKADANPIVSVPKGSMIEYDEPNNSVRLCGARETNWLMLKPLEKQTGLNAKNLSWQEMFDYSRSHVESAEIKRNIRIDIPKDEIIVGVSYTKRKVICIPKQKDISRIGIVGKTGEGKSLILHGLACQLTLCWNYPWCHLYDYKGETYPWVLPAGLNEDLVPCDTLFLTMLNKVNLAPNPIPLVWVYPTMIFDQKKPNESEGVNVEMSLSWRDFMANYEIITEKDSDLSLGAATPYVENSMVGDCKSLEEIYDYVDNGIFDDVGMRKQFAPMLARLKKLSSFIFKKKFVDISCGIDSELRIKKTLPNGHIAYDIKLPVIPALMFAGLNPILVTQKLETIRLGKTEMTPSYISYLVQQLYDIKRNKELFEKKYIYVIIDELGKLTRSGAVAPLIDIATLGRSDGIGFIYANQNWKEIPHHVKEQTDYLFVMRTNDKTEYKEICNDFNDEKVYADDIGNLNIHRKFECYLFHREPLIAYDLDTGNRSVIYKEPIKIILMPPMSKHNEPMEGK